MTPSVVATGLPVLPPFHEGINGTVYAETRTPPSEPGEYRVWLVFEGLEIAAAFKIVELGTGVNPGFAVAGGCVFRADVIG